MQTSQFEEAVEPIEQVVVVGTGFVGLPLALQLAKAGKSVIGVDIDEQLVAAINDQSLNLDEDKLQNLLESDEVEENLQARTSPTSGDAFVVSVPTPLTRPQKSPDLSMIKAAVESIIPHLEEGDLVNIESTIPPLTCEEVVVPMLTEAGFTPGEEIQLAHSPERILPGDVFEEIVHNDRVIGGINEESAHRAAKVYEPFLKGETYFTDLISAELCKLMENTFRDVNIALANEFALIGDSLNLDITEVIELANRHPRVDILNPGIGVGGHCLPIDPWFLNEVNPEHTNLITTARRINDKMPQASARKIRHALSEFDNPTVLALGSTYKPNTQDERLSPANEIVDELRRDGYEIEHFDRLVDEKQYDNLKMLIEKIQPDAIVHLVGHSETISQLEELKPWIADQEIKLIQTENGNPLRL
ncbi:nucleotide sugar dehydrogenase [Haloferax elongans ATCC BAA-1513]|uniref:UDP-N-acetyl-D-mannosamine dehydrogenase n=1 Tax=Haloferax elongans ATCC BAA-1513 TaxID=1230453 RepID=M0HD39_HALEO|nr:nucleotide sugar dehydrogenase [Haloferax elongans]ELZ81723.1 nucleotide sugar dehydrogenase [Haloferax elongans ATCC BAA-1513]